MKAWAGGGSDLWPPPSGRVPADLGRRRQQGLSNTLYKHKKKK